MSYFIYALELRRSPMKPCQFFGVDIVSQDGTELSDGRLRLREAGHRLASLVSTSVRPRIFKMRVFLVTW
jgi:hypothetical protein